MLFRSVLATAAARGGAGLAGLIDTASTRGVMVPICSLGPEQRPRILQHLLALDPQDRCLRFGYAANDEQIQRYVDGLHFERDEIFGIFNSRLDIVAMAHLALNLESGTEVCAEFGVSVQRRSRGRGYGARLFERAAMHARNEGVLLLFIHALSENVPMIKIARKFGATVERDGAEVVDPVRMIGMVVRVDDTVDRADVSIEQLVAQIRRGVDEHNRLAMRAFTLNQD